VKLGLLFNTDPLPAHDMPGVARDAEQAGMAALWVPELFGREPFVTAGALAHATRTIRIGTAIANVYARDPIATKAAAATLGELSGGRFELGLGVSNTVGNTVRGHAWLPPVEKLEQFFTAMDKAELMFKTASSVPVYLAAHGPKLLAFAAKRANGAFTYLSTNAYNADARKRLGQDKRLMVMRPCLIEESPEIARKIARRAIRIYLSLANYHRAWAAQGWKPEDYGDGGSDRFVDALVLWGSEVQVREKLADHANAGVDQVILIALNTDAAGRPRLDMLANLAAH